MSEASINLLAQFKSWRQQNLSQVIQSFREFGQASESAGLECMVYYNMLLSVSVSKLSKFGDCLWDFNADTPRAAKNVQGAKLRIDFSKYNNLSSTAVLELKACLLFYILAPVAVRADKDKKKKIKHNTALGYFESGVRYLNHVYTIVNEELGKDYVEDSCHSITRIDHGTFKRAASTFDCSMSTEIATFFKILKSPLLREKIFDGEVSLIDAWQLDWKIVPKEREDESSQGESVFPNNVFEKASYKSSMLIVDFLRAVDYPVSDTDTLARCQAKGFRISSQYGMDRELLALYTAVRLGAKNYPFDYIIDAAQYFPSAMLNGNTINRKTLQKFSGGLINADLPKYLNLVNYSCCYIVAQYTGMRPSELSEILVEDCLIDEGEYSVIESHLVKHREAYAQLFDNKWVAIPIVRDAIEVAKLIARYKANPYLFSSVDTVAYGEEPKAMYSGSMTYQFEKLFAEVLDEDEYESLDFSPYTLRHTLAYQMFRAELGLPFISHQLKHFTDIVGGYGRSGFSTVTLEYGTIGDMLATQGAHKKAKSLRSRAERESVENIFDPDGAFAGVNAQQHRERNQAIFQGYMAAGYSKEEVFDVMVKQNIAVLNVGIGFCYGKKNEDFDESLPCAGGLRCNPNQCENSVVTKVNAPRWREVYTQNKVLLNDPAYSDRIDQINESLKEARGVLERLGEEVDE